MAWQYLSERKYCASRLAGHDSEAQQWASVASRHVHFPQYVCGNVSTDSTVTPSNCSVMQGDAQAQVKDPASVHGADKLNARQEGLKSTVTSGRQFDQMRLQNHPLHLMPL